MNVNVLSCGQVIFGRIRKKLSRAASSGKGNGVGGRNERRAEDLLFTVYPSLLFEFLKPCTHKSFLRTLIQRTPLIRVFDFHGCSYPRSKNIKQKIPAISNS